jgi:hypothetical protein
VNDPNMDELLRSIQQRRAEVEATIPRELLEKLRAISRDFFQDKPPGTTIEEPALAAYRQCLRDACEEYRRSTHVEVAPTYPNRAF